MENIFFSIKNKPQLKPLKLNFYGNIYEELMPTEVMNHDYTIYFIPEHFPDFDRLNYRMKKGKSFQHQALLNNYLKNNFISISDKF